MTHEIVFEETSGDGGVCAAVLGDKISKLQEILKEGTTDVGKQGSVHQHKERKERMKRATPMGNYYYYWDIVYLCANSAPNTVAGAFWARSVA